MVRSQLVWRDCGVGPQFCLTRNLLTNLPGVERGLAHGFADVAGGDGDTVGCTHRILAGIALQGHS